MKDRFADHQVAVAIKNEFRKSKSKKSERFNWIA
jgi:hypothetical protein